MLQDRPELDLYKPYLTGCTIYISFQTIAEMRYGALWKDWGPARMQLLESFFGTVNIIETTPALAECWAKIMKESRSSGRRLEAGDAWIGACALLMNFPLLTHDRDFDIRACPSLEIIRLPSL